MKVLINAENINLGPRTKLRMVGMLEELQLALKGDPQVRLFLKKLGKNNYSSTLTVRTYDHDIAYSAKGEKLMPLVRSVESHLLKRIRDQKQRIVDGRKRGPRHFTAA